MNDSEEIAQLKKTILDKDLHTLSIIIERNGLLRERRTAHKELRERLEKAQKIQEKHINSIGEEWGPDANVDEEVAVLTAITEALALLTPT